MSPFEVLGMAASRDLAAVKRAYFDALKRHPPHADAEGFRRVRAAYEELRQPGALAWACARAPFDFGAAGARYEARFGAALAEAANAQRGEADSNEAVERFVAKFSCLSLAEALAAAGPGGEKLVQSDADTLS